VIDDEQLSVFEHLIFSSCAYDSVIFDAAVLNEINVGDGRRGARIRTASLAGFSLFYIDKAGSCGCKDGNGGVLWLKS